MHVIVVGGGLVGSTLAAKLSHDGHDVVVIERDRSQLQDLSEDLDVQSIAGNGSKVTVLKEAGVEHCDLLVASTNIDEVNLVVAMTATSMFKVPRVVARVRDNEHETVFQCLTEHLPGERICINPDQAAVDRIVSLLNIPGAIDVVPFLDKKLFVAGFPIPKGSDFDGLSLSHIPLLFPSTPVLVSAIKRDQDWIIPSGRDELRAGDLVYFALDPSQLQNIMVLLGIKPDREHRVVIAGATRIGLSLAKRLESMGVPVILFEHDEKACMEAAQALNSTVIIHGSPTNRRLLEEENVDRASEFVACTDDHEVNVVSCLLAKRLGPVRTFALVDNPALAGLLGDVGIDVVISPRLLSVGLALQYARQGRVTADAALIEEHIEVMEVEIDSKSRMADKTIAALGLPKGVVIAAVLRHDQLFLPKGNYPLLAGDRVLFITTAEMASTLDSFLCKRSRR